MGVDKPSVTVRVAEPGHDDLVACALMTEYLAWGIDQLALHYGILQPPTEATHVPASLADYRAPTGVLLLAWAEDEQPAGVGAIHRRSEDIVEVKRMYVAPLYRAQHVGSTILDQLLAEAERMRARTVRLDTCRFMSDAQRLYRSRGFVERAPYAESEIPAHLQQYWMFFEKVRPA
jgi:GNAT superfamily N-acetyltransferase